MKSGLGEDLGFFPSAVVVPKSQKPLTILFFLLPKLSTLFAFFFLRTFKGVVHNCSVLSRLIPHNTSTGRLAAAIVKRG